ncbi:MAG: hypothetical protein PHQ22_10285 [Sulfuricurvum sp.]|nr:hypothetical protein [Sulfuricurvum sp.]
MTHEENRAILNFGDNLTAQLKMLAGKCETDRVGIYMALTVLQANLLRVQTQDITQMVREATIGDPVKEAERIAREG